MRLFVTVGSALQPFDHLMSVVEQALDLSGLPVEGLCQFGSSTCSPPQLEARQALPRPEFDAALARADVVLCHAGVGTLFSAIAAGHTPLVMARRASRNEVVNDHQQEIVRALASMGRVIPVETAEDVAAALRRFASGELRRGPPRETSDATLAPIRFALESARASRPGTLRRLALLALARLSPVVPELLQRDQRRR